MSRQRFALEPVGAPPPGAVLTAAPSRARGEVTVTDDLDLLIAVLPLKLQRALAGRRDALVEVVLDLGRIPEARFADRVEELSSEPVAAEDLRCVVDRVGRFGADNRAGIERTLHRISALRNRMGEVVGLTCRVGRSVFGTVDVVRDVIEAGESTLLLGRPGVGKTTLLREAARVLAVDLGKRVIVVDTSNEIAGDGDIPHPGIGRARRMQVPSPERQHEVLIEAVENHMPEVIVIDEIGTAAEALAARTIAERGVQLIATAHGNTLENLLRNPTLSDLVGGIHAVTLSDGEARRRGTQKTVLERKAAPTFGVVIEIQAKDRLAVHHRIGDVVDGMLRGFAPRAELRVRNADGEVAIERPEPIEPPPALGGPRRWRDSRGWGAAARRPSGQAGSNGGAPATEGTEAAPSPGIGRKLLRLFPYAVSRGKLDRAIRDLRVPAVLVDRLEDADVVLTTKGQERRQPRRLRDAELRGTRLELVKSNTVKQIERFLADEFGIEPLPGEPQEALREAQDAIDQVLDEGRPVELAPQDRYVRRVQHELVVSAGLASESKGQEPFRRVVVYPGGIR